MGTGTEIRKKLEDLTSGLKLENLSASSNQYSHIELTEEEKTEALRVARENKHFLLRRLEYAEQLRARRSAPKFTAEQLYEFFSAQFDVDDENQIIVKNLCCYFTDDSRFRGDLNKGLLLFGGVGTGKTTLMNFFRRNQKASYRVMSCREIESEFSSEGEKAVQNCSYNIDIAENPFCQTSIGLCLDDLGTETNGKFFGKEKNVMAEILLNRYQNVALIYTHLTTNLSMDEIISQYGDRVADRFREMFNIIEFSAEAKSRRK